MLLIIRGGIVFKAIKHTWIVLKMHKIEKKKRKNIENKLQYKKKIL